MRQGFEILDMLVKWKNMMEKQTCRKIKVLQIDNIREYKDQFLQFGQYNKRGIHFKICKHEVAKEMNHFYWRRYSACCLMHNWTSLFCADTLEYASLYE